MKRALILAAVAALCAACSKPRVDATSEETLKASIAKARESLPESRREKFNQSLQLLMRENMDLGSIVAAGGLPQSITAIAKPLDGKTGEEIIAAGEAVEKRQAEARRERDLKEIAELVKERDASLAATQELAKFEILRARFTLERGSYGMAEPKILLRVKNGTAHPVARAFFTGRLVSPGRPVPWLQEDFNYSIPGGVNPGEEATWNLAPNSFSAWGTVNVPDDAGLEVTVVKLEGPSGSLLFSVQDFTDSDRARLVSLQQQYGLTK